MDITMLLSLPVLAVATLLYLIDKSHTEDNYLAITPESCTCPGDELILECTIEGDAGTYWQGTALEECLQRRILIRHSQFHGSGHIDTNLCGTSGTIVVRTISAVNNSFTTRFTIIVNQQLNGSTIECVSDRGRVIGSSQIWLKTVPRVSSVYLALRTAKQRTLTFMWTNGSETCPGTNYKIVDRNCGDCPQIVNSSFVTCNMFELTQGAICSFTVQSVVCGNVFGEAADPIAVIMNSPSSPQITHVDILHNRSVHAFFHTADSHSQCQIGQNPVISYTIKYFDPQTNVSCGLDTIVASSCGDQICNSVFDLNPFCSNSTSVSVTVLATGAHGDVQESEPFIIVVQSGDNANYGHQILGQDATKTIIITVGSILGGIILLLLLAIILLPLLTCHAFRSCRSKRQHNGINLEEPIPGNGINFVENVDAQNETDVHEDKIRGEVLELITMDATIDTNDAEESGEEKHQKAELETVVYENKFHDIDKSVNLDSLLIQIRRQVTPKWYQFGLAVGINKETLDEFSNFPPEECIVEMLDLWLRTSKRAVTWRDVADSLKQIGLYQLAERTLKAYKTGKLLTGFGAQSFPQQNLIHPYESIEQLTSKPPNNDNNKKEPVPPLPPKAYQCTSELY